MSKSSLFFYLVAFLTAAASLRSVGARSGNFHQALLSETHADIASLRDDAGAIRHLAERAPTEFRTLWNDALIEARTLEADAAADARFAAARISTLI